MKETTTQKRHVTARGAQTQSVSEDDVITNNTGRSRWIATLVIMLVLGLGGWVIAQRVMPYAFDGVATTMRMSGESAGSGMMMQDAMYDAIEPSFVPREDLQVTKSLSVGMVAPEMGMALSDEEMAYDGDDANTENVSDRKTRKTGNMSIVVDSISWTVGRVGEIAQEYGGEIMNTNLYADERERMFGTIYLRVAAEHFDTAFDALKTEVAKVVESENTDTQDVTEEYVDLEAQLKNKRSEEVAFAAILEQSGKVDDVIRVTRELSRVRGEIERLEGRLRYMNARTDFAYITLSLREDEKVVSPDTAWRPSVVAKQSLNHLIANAQAFIDNVIRFATVFVPTFLLYVLVIVVLWHIVKKTGVAMMTKWQQRQENTDTK